MVSRPTPVARYCRNENECFRAICSAAIANGVTHPASITHAGLLPDELEASGICPGTVRVTCGLEHPDDVVADIVQALDHVLATTG